MLSIFIILVVPKIDYYEIKLCVSIIDPFLLFTFYNWNYILIKVNMWQSKISLIIRDKIYYSTFLTLSINDINIFHVIVGILFSFSICSQCNARSSDILQAYRLVFRLIAEIRKIILTLRVWQKRLHIAVQPRQKDCIDIQSDLKQP